MLYQTEEVICMSTNGQEGYSTKSRYLQDVLYWHSIFNQVFKMFCNHIDCQANKFTIKVKNLWCTQSQGKERTASGFEKAQKHT